MGKTECLLFGSNRRLKKVNDFDVLCDGNAVKRVFQAKYLGVILDATFSSSFHVANVLKVSMSRLAFLYRNSSLLDFSTRRTLCMALIQPYLDYCSASWYDGLTSLHKSRLDVLTRKMVRFVFGFDNRHHVGPSEFRSLSWLKISDRVMYFKLIHLFKIRQGLAPNYLRSRFSSVSDMHSHSTRGSRCNFHLSRSAANAPSSFTFTSARQWNTIPNRIKEMNSLPSFKRELKKYLISRYT